MTAATGASTSAAAKAKTGQTKQRVITLVSYAILFGLAAMFLYPFLYCNSDQLQAAARDRGRSLPSLAGDVDYGSLPATAWPERTAFGP